MPKKLPSAPNGASSAETTEIPLVTQSSSAANRSTSATWGFTPAQSLTSQPTQKSKDAVETETRAKVLFAFAALLGDSVTWRKLTLEGAGEVVALCFPLDKWDFTDGRLTLR